MDNIVLDNSLDGQPAKNDSLKKRWLYKLFANFVGFGMNLIIQLIVPRSLGPSAYGNFSFLTNFFSQLVAFFDLGTSTCFYTSLSQRPKERELVSFYLYFTGFVAFCVVAFVALIMLTQTYPKFCPGQEPIYIYLAAGYGILTWMIQIVNSMIDAHGITVIAEKAKILQKILSVSIIALLYLTHQINLMNFFYFQYLILSFLMFLFLYIMHTKGYFIGQKLVIAFDKIKEYIQEFYQYTHPLVIYSIIGVLSNILDRWLLQVFAGNVQQGFFAFSFQIGALCFLFAGALTPLLAREFSIAHVKKDSKEIGRIFERYMPILLLVTAFLTCFIASQAQTLAQIIGGDKYKDSMWPIFIMTFYPIYQVYGQVCGSIFLSTGQTKIYSKIGIIFMLIGIPVTYFFIAPVTMGGFNAGAVGLATKTIVVQFLGVNALLYYSARLLGFSFYKYLLNQIVVIGLLLIGALVSSFVVYSLMGFLNIYFKFIVSGGIYTVFTMAMLYLFPFLFFLKKDDINSILSKILLRS